MDFDFFLYENFFWPWWESLKWVIRASLYSHMSGCWITLPRPPTLWNLIQIKKLLRVVEVSTLVSHRKLYRKVSTERKHTWKYPATYNETSCSRPSPFTRSPKHGHPQLPSHHPASLKKKKKILNIDFYKVCFADNVSPEYHEITKFSYKVLMQF